MMDVKDILSDSVNINREELNRLIVKVNTQIALYAAIGDVDVLIELLSYRVELAGIEGKLNYIEKFLEGQN